MKKHLLLSALAYLLTAGIFAQNVAINTDGSLPDPSAMLDVKSADKGLLIPRIALTGTDDLGTIPSPQTSLLIYNTSSASVGATAVTPGFYFWAGSVWQRFSLIGNSALSPWVLGGNAGTDPLQHFIGTTDSQPLVFKINNQVAGTLGFSDNTSYGVNTLLNSTGNLNIAIGSSALRNNSTGSRNSASGTFVLAGNTTGSGNTASGFRGLNWNTTGNGNSAFGSLTLRSNTIGGSNTAVGESSLFANTTGNYNTAIGSGSLINNMTGNKNTAVGYWTDAGNNLENATSIGANARVDCSNCIVLGSVNGINNATSSISTGIGTTNPNASSVLDLTSTEKGLLIPRMTQPQRDAVSSPATGLMIYQTDAAAGFYYFNGTTWTPVSGSTSNLWSLNGNAGTDPNTNFIGTSDNQPLVFKVNNQAAATLGFLNSNTSFGVSTLVNSGGDLNTAIGWGALQNNSTGRRNSALGYSTLSLNTTGIGNTASGFSALNRNTTGRSNSAYGLNAMFLNNQGNFNTAIGDNSLYGNSSGSYNTAVGSGSLGNNSTGTQNTALGYRSDVGTNLDNATAIGAQSKVDCSNCLVLGSVSGANGAGSNVNVGVGTTNPNSSSLLDLTSSDKGLLIPRMTQAQRDAIASPSTSLLIYQTDGTAGFYYYNGTVWTSVGGNTNNLWSLNGNAGTNPGTNFIGTSDNQPLIFKINNQTAGFIRTDGNVAFGLDALISNTDGNHNTGFGWLALNQNTTGFNNTATGTAALTYNTTGANNTANGENSLALNTSGSNNTAVGTESLKANTTGDGNTAVGKEALSSNTSGQSNTATGAFALQLNTSGNNTADGYKALWKNTSGYANTASGTEALAKNTTGFVNTAHGFNALSDNIDGYFNTAMGVSALSSNTSGYSNTAMGEGALSNNSTGYSNTGIGYRTNVSSANLNNATAIGFNAIVDASNKVRIGNGAVTVIEGQVPFTTPSDGRYKYNVLEDVKGLDFILKLRPVTYQFDVKKLDNEMQPAGFKNTSYALQTSYDEAASIRRTGFIAQEVEKAAGESGYNFSGINKPQSAKDHYGLSYESFVVPLVKAIQEQQKQIDDLKNENSELKKLKEQLDALIKTVESLSANQQKQ